MKPKILLLDDEESLIKWVSYALGQKGYQVVATTEPSEALTYMRDQKFDCIISDIRMPQIDGFEFLRKVRRIYPDVPVLFITAYGSLESAINAIRDRASDYILKPFSIDEILLRLRANLGLTKERQNIIIGESKEIRAILQLVRKVATTDTTILILGESGTGKELIAREIHSLSNRVNNRFVTISCAALPETLLESELFGYKKGAFTGAASDKDGLFKVADRGTFFLDEIGDAPPTIQMKLLRLLEEKTFTPLGSTIPVRVDVRLIAATNKDLREEVRVRRFREDLYYRLNVIPITLPPLRQRKEDIPVLADHFLKLVSKREELGERRFSEQAREYMLSYRWPGNVRELKYAVERAAILSDSYFIKPEHFGFPTARSWRRKSLKELRDEEINKVINECNGNITKAAKVLGVGRATLYRKLKSRKKTRRAGTKRKK